MLWLDHRLAGEPAVRARSRRLPACVQAAAARRAPNDGHDGREVAKRHAGIERVDADIDLLAWVPRIEHLAHRAPRADLLLRRDRILKVEDQRIGRSLLGAFKLAQAVARNKQE